jgi:chemotaxis protein MotB
MSARRRKHHEEHEEHENHERWLITYADMITLLMVLFIVLFSMSQVDLAKYKKFKDGLGGGASQVVDGGAGVLDNGAGLLTGTATTTTTVKWTTPASKTSTPPTSAGTAGSTVPGTDTSTPPTTVSIQQAAYDAERRGLGAAEQELRGALAGTGKADAVDVTVQQRGLVITVLADQVLFQPGSATLEPAASPVLDAIAESLRALPNPVTVEGHTDNVPVGPGSRYSSNWELSTARATTVLRTLVERDGIDPQRMSAAGYADTRPIASNDDPAGRSRNRRVELVVRSLVDAPRETAATGAGSH